jgi:hypothetical protein
MPMEVRTSYSLSRSVSCCRGVVVRSVPVAAEVRAGRLKPAPKPFGPQHPRTGRPPLLDSILLPATAQPPARKYLDWHGTNVFAA